MDWLTILGQIFEVCIIPLLGILTAILVNLVKVKTQTIVSSTDSEIAEKYIKMLSDTITSCVIATNQTYVDNLKKENAFTAEAQEYAFQQTYNAVMNILSEEAQVYLSEIYGDLSKYITQKIEAEVALQK